MVRSRRVSAGRRSDPRSFNPGAMPTTPVGDHQTLPPGGQLVTKSENRDEEVPSTSAAGGRRFGVTVTATEDRLKADPLGARKAAWHFDDRRTRGRLRRGPRH